MQVKLSIRWSLAALVVAGSAARAHAQCETAILTDAAPQFGELMGNSVAVANDVMVVGAMLGGPTGLGRAYVYVKQGGSWTLAAALRGLPEQGGSMFGAAVSISGTGGTIVVGAQGYDHSSKLNPGLGFVFVEPAGGWSSYAGALVSQSADLACAAPLSGDNMGTAVATTDTRVILGAPGDFGGTLVGRAMVFEKPGGGWSGTLSQTAIVTPTGGGADDGFGSSVGIAAPGVDLVLVGAPFHDVTGASNCGAVYAFTRLNVNTWPQEQKLTASPNAASLGLGFSIAVGGVTTVLAGAPGHSGGQGAAYYFDRSGTSWSQAGQIVASDGAALDDFGAAVALDGNQAYVGARGDDDLGSGSGSAYVFDRNGAAGISQVAKLVASNGVAGDGFGRGLGAHDGTIGIGATGADYGGAFSVGAAYAFELLGEVGTPYAFCGTGPCSNDDGDSGCINASNANGARLIGVNSAIVANDDLVLLGQGLNPNVNGILFMGDNQTSAFLDNGVIGVSGSIRRFAVQSASALGVFTEGPGLIAHINTTWGAGTVAPGITKQFQVWYRDAAGPCGHGANLTNAVSITFQ